MSARIFLVEDEAIIAMELKDRLRELGHVVCGHAVRGDQALTLIPKTNPDLILMDINLRGSLTGIDVAEQLALRDRVPIIFLTAYHAAEVMKRAGRFEATGFLVKPFETERLQAAIEAALVGPGSRRNTAGEGRQEKP